MAECHETGEENQFPQFNSSVAARVLFDKSAKALDETRSENSRLREELQKVQIGADFNAKAHNQAMAELQRSLHALRTERNEAVDAFRKMQSDTELKNKEDKCWQKDYRKLEEGCKRQLKEAQESVINARKEARLDSEKRELSLREALNTSRDAAEMKVEQVRKTAELQVRDAVELKRLAEESARVAWAEMQTNRSEADEASMALLSERRDNAMQQDKLRDELQAARWESEAAKAEAAAAAKEATVQLAAYQERIQEQVKLSLEDEGQRAVVVHGALQLEQQVANLKDELANVKVFYAQHFATKSANRAQTFAQTRALTVIEGATTGQELTVDVAETATAIASLPPGEMHSAEAEVRRHYFEESRLKVLLNKSEEARMQAEKRALQALKRSDATTILAAGQQHLQVASAEQKAAEEADQLRVMLYRSNTALKQAEDRISDLGAEFSKYRACTTAELASLKVQNKDDVDMAGSECNAARMARDAAILEKGKYLEQIGQLRAALMDAHAEHKKEEMLRAAEVTHTRAQVRLLQEELKAEHAASQARSHSPASGPTAPFAALRDASKAELELASLRVRRITDERDEAERVAADQTSRLRQLEQDMIYERDRCAADISINQKTLASERDDNTHMHEDLRQMQTRVDKLMLGANIAQKEAEEQIKSLKNNLDAEITRRMMAESKVEALYETLGANRHVQKEQVTELTEKQMELKEYLNAKVREAEERLEASNQLALQRAVEGEALVGNLRDQLASSQSAGRQSTADTRHLQTQLEEARKCASETVSHASLVFNRDRLKLRNELEVANELRERLEGRQAEMETELFTRTSEATRLQKEAAQQSGLLLSVQRQLEECHVALSHTEHLAAAWREETEAKMDTQQRDSNLSLTQARAAVLHEREIALAQAQRLETLSQEMATDKQEQLRTGGANLVARMDEVKCAICKQMMTQPHSLAICSHTFCRICICDKVTLDEPKCPVCNVRASRRDVVPNVALGVLIDGVRKLLDGGLTAPQGL